MKTFNYNLIAILLFISFVIPSNSLAESLIGQVVDRRSIPITGMEVRLFHPGPGLSRPRYTDARGVFFFDFVPPVRGRYDIEYYWKGELIYRGSISIVGNTQLPTLAL